MLLDPLDLGRHQSPVLTEARLVAHTVLRPPFRVLLWFRMRNQTSRWWKDPATSLAIVGLSLDAFQGWRLRDGDRVRTAERAVADLADLAVLQQSSSWPTGVAPVTAAPLVGELAALYGWPAASLPLAEFVALFAVAKLMRRPFSPAVHVTQVAALVGGLGLRKFERERALKLRAELEGEIEQHRFELRREGVHRVVRARYRHNGLHWETPHDAITGLRGFFPDREQLDSQSPLAVVLAGRKGIVHANVVSAKTRDLFSALEELRNDLNAEANRSHPADQLLRFAVPEGIDNLVTISSGQFHELAEYLNARDPGGRPRFTGLTSVEVTEDVRPGKRIVLRINGKRVILPADPSIVSRFDWTDPTAAALAIGIVWTLADATHAFHKVEARWVLPGAASFAAAAIWANQIIRQRGERAHYSIALASLLPAAVHTVSVIRGLEGRTTRPDSSPCLPIEIATKATALALGFTMRSLTTRQRLVVCTGSAALTVAGVLSSHSKSWRHTAFMLSWNLCGLVAMARYRSLVESAARRQVSEFAVGREVHEDVEVRAGACSEWRLLDEAARQALSLLPDAEYYQVAREDLNSLRAAAERALR
jgi:hypothetical protein